MKVLGHAVVRAGQHGKASSSNAVGPAPSNAVTNARSHQTPSVRRRRFTAVALPLPGTTRLLRRRAVSVIVFGPDALDDHAVLQIRKTWPCIRRRQKVISCIRLLRRDGRNRLASRTGLAYSGLSPP